MSIKALDLWIHQNQIKREKNKNGFQVIFASAFVNDEIAEEEHRREVKMEVCFLEKEKVFIKRMAQLETPLSLSPSL